MTKSPQIIKKWKLIPGVVEVFEADVLVVVDVSVVCSEGVEITEEAISVVTDGDVSVILSFISALVDIAGYKHKSKNCYEKLSITIKEIPLQKLTLPFHKPYSWTLAHAC